MVSETSKPGSFEVGAAVPPVADKRSAGEEVPAETKARDLSIWWRRLATVAGVGTAIPTLIAAGVSIATLLVSYATEAIKVDASYRESKLQAAVAAKAREDKAYQDDLERRNLNAAKLRELQTKYVDLALGRQLCLDYRVRVFGYLSAVLAGSEKVWAETELRDARKAQDNIRALRDRLGEARQNLVSQFQIAMQEFKASGVVADNVKSGLAVIRQTNEENIKAIEDQLAIAQRGDPPCVDTSLAPK